VGGQAEDRRCYKRSEELFAPFHDARAGASVKPRDCIHRGYAQAADHSRAEQVVEIRGVRSRPRNVAPAFVSLVGPRLRRSIAQQEVLAFEDADRLLINGLARPYAPACPSSSRGGIDAVGDEVEGCDESSCGQEDAEHLALPAR
jgi:hypothetical protein